jgi:hypothetical protein
MMLAAYGWNWLKHSHRRIGVVVVGRGWLPDARELVFVF